MSKLLRGSKLVSTRDGTATLKGCLDVNGSVFGCHSDWGWVGTTGIPQVGPGMPWTPLCSGQFSKTSPSQMSTVTSQEPLRSVALFIMLCSADRQPDCRGQRCSMKNKWDVRDRKGRKAGN